MAIKRFPQASLRDDGVHSVGIHLSLTRVRSYWDEEEANDLWVKYIDDAKSKLRDGEEPQMCIWINCKNNGDYHTKDEIKDLDYSDCEYINGRVYRVIKTMIA